MRLEHERQLVVDYAQRLRRDRLVVLTAGNVSLRAGELVAITPAGVDYDLLRPDLICLIGLDGSIVEAELPPSSERPLHLAVYRNPQAGAVVHTHSPYATTLATLVDEVPTVHYLFAELGGSLRVAPYATFGSSELAEGVAEALAGRNAALLASHGAVSVGETLEQAYDRAVLLESLCALYYRARLLGDPAVLGSDEIARVAERLQRHAPPASP
jgi:L-fuculose-phosphate aldolase